MGSLPRWEDQHKLLIELAQADLRIGGFVTPTIIAFKGDDPLMVVTVRQFEKGEHKQALIEVLSAGMMFEADRYKLSLTGMAWSTADPIPPVTEGVDMRQPVLIIHTAECGEVSTAVHAINDGVVGEEAARETGEGPTVTLLQAASVTHGELETASRNERASSLVHLDRLGHKIAATPALKEMLA